MNLKQRKKKEKIFISEKFDLMLTVSCDKKGLITQK